MVIEPQREYRVEIPFTLERKKGDGSDEIISHTFEIGDIVMVHKSSAGGGMGPIAYTESLIITASDGFSSVISDEQFKNLSLVTIKSPFTPKNIIIGIIIIVAIIAILKWLKVF